MKKLLFLFAVLLTSVGAWAQPQVSDAPSNGQWAVNTTWFQIKNQKNKVIRADVLTDEGYLAMTNQNVIKSDVALWCIVGNETNGYKFYNRAIGPSKVLGMKGSEDKAYAEFIDPNEDGYTKAFDIVESTDNGYWCMKDHGSANKYWNQRDPRLAYWDNSSAQKGDDGSSFSFTEVDLSQVEYATEDAITAAKAIIKKAPGYPKVTSAQYGMLNDLVNLKQVVVSDLTSAVSAYKTCSDIILPESGKAYKIVNYSKNPEQELRYMNYTAGFPLSVETLKEKASVFVCHELSAGVYVLITEDGKILTWPHASGGYKEEGTSWGYSSFYATQYMGYSDWNKITIKKNHNGEADFGHLRMVARRYYEDDKQGAPYSSFIVKGASGDWDGAGDNYYLDTSGQNWYSSAWIFTEVEHSLTDAQVQALAKINVKEQLKGLKLGSYCLVDKNGNKLYNVESVGAVIDAATSIGEIDALLATRTLSLPTQGKAYYLKDSHGTYLDIHNLGIEKPGSSYSQLATLSTTKQLLYITGSETDGTWKIHTAPEGGNYMYQHPTANRWNSWVEAGGSDFKWEVEGIEVNDLPHFKLKNISGTHNGYLGADNHTSGSSLFVNQSLEYKMLKMQLLPVKSVCDMLSVSAEWLNEECVDVATTAEIPQGIKNLSNYSTFVDEANYTQKLKTSGEHFYLSAGRLTGLFNWRSGSGTQRVNIVAIEVVDMDGTVVVADYHYGYAGNPSENNTYSVDVPRDGLYYLRYYAETKTNGGINNSDIDITYTLMPKEVYIAADALQTDGTYLKHFLYNDDGTLRTSTRVSDDDKFKWTVEFLNNGNYTFVNKAGEKLGYDHNNVKGLVIADDAIELSLSSANAVHAGSLGMQRIGSDTDGKYMVTKSDGSAFNRNGSKINSSGANGWTSDYILTSTTIDNLAIAKLNAKNNELRGKDFGLAVCQYHYLVDGEKVYDASAIEEASTVEEVNAAIASISINLPEVGKYYRIKGKGSGKYLDAVNRYSGNQMGMKTEAERDFLGSIFLLDEGSKLLNMGTNTYIKETYNIGADKNGANTWTFEASPRTVGCLLVKSNASSPYLHDSGYANRCSGDGCAEHDFVLEEVNYFQLTVNVQSKIYATATWKGITKVLPNSWIFFEGEPVDNTILTINGNASHACTSLTENWHTNEGNTLDIGVLSENRTLTANFTPAFFSSAYGDKWVRIQNCSNGSYWANVENGEQNAKGKTATLDNTYTDDKQLWCLVGDANNFILYNKAAGSDLALEVADCNQETAATLVAKTGATWKLKEQEFGYAIMPASADNTSERGINMWGGNGGELKLYSTAEGNKGSYWKIEAANPLTLSVEVEAGQPYATNTRVANLNTIVNSATSSTVVKGDVDALNYYLPVGATFTLNNSLTYRGYIFNGFVDEDGNAVDTKIYTNATLTEGGLNITASYSVDETNKYQYLFYNRDDVHNKPYRIPAIATASNNTVLAFSDYRPCSNDIGYGEVDIMLRRSYDNGETWSDAVCIADGQGGNDNVFNVGFGDAAVVTDRESGKVLVMAVAGKQVFAYGSATGHNSMAKIVSNDNGESWNAPEDVTSQFMIAENSLFPKAYTMFFGSGRMLQSRVYKAEGAAYYRIYGALLIKHPSDTYTGECNYVVYSDDFGATWKILGGSIEAGMCCNGGNEPKVEELPDGSIVLSSRKYNGRYFNVFTYTDKATGAGTWSTAVASNDQTDGISFGGNATNGEIYKVKAIHNESGRICDVMLQSIPTGGGRSNVSVYFKEMSYAEAYTPTTFAQNWTKGLEVSAMGSAYSTMILQADGNFGFFYEELPGDNNAYCMVYVPLSLEELTYGAYSLYTVNSTIGEHKVGTFYATEAMQIPEGVRAYVATVAPEMVDGVGKIHMTELSDIIPANTGAVLRAEADSYKFIPSISYGTPVENNMLVGYEAADNKSESYNEFDAEANSFVLTVKEGKAAFYLWESSDRNPRFRVYNNKAYLQLSATGEARAIYFSFDDETTGISEIENVSLDAENVYDLSGRRVEKLQKGFYIVNGKKILK